MSIVKIELEDVIKTTDCPVCNVKAGSPCRNIEPPFAIHSIRAAAFRIKIRVQELNAAYYKKWIENLTGK